MTAKTRTTTAIRGEQVEVTTSHPLELDPDGAYVVSVAVYDRDEYPRHAWDEADALDKETNR